MSEKARIVFSMSPSFRIVPANGIWGGVAPDRSVIANFYVDYRKSPDALTVEVSGGVVSESQREGENVGATPIYLRESQIAVMVSAVQAHAMGKWFLEKAREAGFVEQSEKH